MEGPLESSMETCGRDQMGPEGSRRTQKAAYHAEAVPQPVLDGETSRLLSRQQVFELGLRLGRRHH